MTLPLVQAAMDDLRVAHRHLLRVVDSLSNDDWSRPVVARLAGTNLEEGDRILRDSKLPVVRAADLGEAARKAVEAAAATAT